MKYTEEKRLTVAIIGCGQVGEREASAVVSTPGLKLIGVSDIGPAFRDKALQMGNKYECDAVHEWHHLVTRDDIDIAIISTPMPIAANRNHSPIKIEKQKIYK